MPGTYFKTCPQCGAHLDPGETCDCQASSPEPRETEKAK